MDRLVSCRFAEKVSDVESRNRVWYIPHFGVQNVNKPGRVRLVFDAAAKSGNNSLNMLLPGLDLLKSLVGFFMRFRQFAYAVTSDIKDMFMGIEIIEQDRDEQRFLWQGKDRDREPDVYRMRVLLFGATSSTSTAIYVKNINASKFAPIYPIASKKIIHNCYTDVYLDSLPSEEEAIEVGNQVKWINSLAEFKMHKWASNNSRVKIAISPEEASGTAESSTY
ncbi:hypothetical protein TKK_0016162 [Trichogramma kaykai]|uniref:Uncharacterized protein n=1 Tax=Trichogramma kaykai TaxID=54128 RepID=A0ABD2W9T4_9HYME